MAAPSIGATHAQALTLRICRRTLAPALLAFIGVLSSTAAQAYKPGDTVEPAVLERLGATGSRITIVDFFAEWCVSCRKELPLISAVNARSDQRKVEFVGIDTDDNPATAEAFQKELKARSALNFRVVNDPTQSLVGKFKPRGYPALYIIKDGKIVREHLGAMPNVDAVIEQDLKALGV
jgi:thiol-disulfide isomerase/thioredoxin